MSDDTIPRVCVVSPMYHTSFGGVGRQAVALTERLARLGAAPFVITRSIRGVQECPLSPDVPVYRVPTLFPRTLNLEGITLVNLLVSLSFCIGLAVLLIWKMRSYDVVHFHGASLPLIKNILLLKILRKKVIAKVVVAGSGVEPGSLVGRYLALGSVMTWFLRLVDRYVAISAEIEQALLAEGYEKERIARIPNFVDPEVFRPGDESSEAKVRKRYGWGDRKIVMFSGRLVERKGIGTLLDAWKTVAPEHEDAHLVILGGGPMDRELKEKCRSLGLENRVEFPGYVTDMPDCLAASDVFVFPSFREGFPNAVLEAMACGLPVVACIIGGVTDVILYEQNGLLVEPGNADRLAAALKTLLDDPEHGRRLGSRALQTVREDYGIDTIAQKYLGLYRQLTGGAQ